MVRERNFSLRISLLMQMGTSGEKWRKISGRSKHHSAKIYCKMTRHLTLVKWNTPMKHL